jgi:hypothetical protein
VIGRLALALGGFGLCFVAVNLTLTGTSLTFAVIDAVARRADAVGVIVGWRSPGVEAERILAVSLVLALGLSRPLVVSRLASLAFFAGAALAFWLFPLAMAAVEHERLSGSWYLERVCTAMIVGGLLAELLVHLYAWRRPDRVRTPPVEQRLV